MGANGYHPSSGSAPLLRSMGHGDTVGQHILRGCSVERQVTRTPWSVYAHGSNLPLRSRPVLDPRVKSMVTKTCVLCSADTGSLMEISVATWSHECQDLSPIMHRRQGTTYRKQTRLLEKGQSFTAIVRYPLEPSPATQSTV